MCFTKQETPVGHTDNTVQLAARNLGLDCKSEVNKNIMCPHEVKWICFNVRCTQCHDLQTSVNVL